MGVVAGSGGAGNGGGAASGANGEGMDVDLMRSNVGGTGGASGAGMGGSGSGGAPSAGGSPSAEGGAAGANATGGSGSSIDVPASTRTVPASVGTCPAFTPCGGALDGIWTYASVCLDPAELGLDLLQGLCEGSSIAFEDGAGATLAFDRGQVARRGEALGDGSLIMPIDCVDAMLGGCAELEPFLGIPCVESATSCTCSYPATVDFGQQPATSDGSVFVFGDGRTFDYCVEGDELRYRETGDVQEDGLYTLIRN
jgi:hypothetical protein